MDIASLKLKLLEFMTLEEAKLAFEWVVPAELREAVAPSKDEAPKAEVKPKAEAKPKAKAETKAEKPVEAPKPEEKTDAAVLDYAADVVPVIVKTVARIDADTGAAGTGKAKVLEVLQTFGVSHGKDVPPGKRADFVAALEAL